MTKFPSFSTATVAKMFATGTCSAAAKPCARATSPRRTGRQDAIDRLSERDAAPQIALGILVPIGMEELALADGASLSGSGR
ncbi:uncharacterized protein METZ01_LOCUS362078 [marine metagenome]|uniref:Uncharacterized protein n=1 Tax=marine metagenome TaxID=408172 RepID=A0A382SH45_9ZZZZ